MRSLIDCRTAVVKLSVGSIVKRGYWCDAVATYKGIRHLFNVQTSVGRAAVNMQFGWRWTMFKILLALNEKPFAGEVAKLFSADDFEIHYAEDGLQVLKLANSRSYDSIILDRHITKASAFEICKLLRLNSPGTGVFLVNADTTAEEDMAVTFGADQCLLRPVDPRALNARVRAMLRRKRSPENPSQLQCHDLVLDIKTGLLTKNGEQIDLRPMEFVLLQFLMKHQGRVYSCADLWSNVWKRKGLPSDSVRAHIAMLRKKLGCTNGYPLIKTIVGRGYKLEPPQ
jgi:DNA-binding response OmpR family regulator